jgi:hypothetical protein
MNQTNETVPPSSNAKQTEASNSETPEKIRDWLQDKLRLAKAYWQQIQPFIIDRKLDYLEFEVASRAHSRVKETVANARKWNAGEWPMGVNKCNGNDGKQFPIPAAEFPDRKNFLEPERSRIDQNLMPETLAKIAAPMIGQRRPKLLPFEAVRIALDLYSTAQDYLNMLRKLQSRRLRDRIVTGDNSVSFVEIEQSNRRNSGQLPLLPPISKKRKGISEEESRMKPLSKTAIRNAVRLFLVEHKHSQAEINVCLKTQRISLQDLCTMRWERFKSHSQLQRSRAIAREAKKH